MAELSLKSVSKEFGGGVIAVDDVDLDFSSGKLTALLGPSGCGKTTLLRMIAGLDTPTTGRIEPCDHAQQSCLAAARRPQKRRQLAGGKVKIDVIDGDNAAAEFLADSLEREIGHSGPARRQDVTSIFSQVSLMKVSLSR